MSQRPNIPNMTYRTPGGSGPGSSPRPRKKRRSLTPQFIELIAIIAFVVIVYEGGMWLWERTAPKEVSIPKVVGLQSDEAQAVLKTAGLAPDIVAEKPNESVPEGVVLGVDPPTGRLVKAGREVHLTLSSGSRWAIVPNVQQMSVDRARALLSKARLSAGKQTVTYDPKAPIGYVMGQNPKPKQRVARNSEVALLVSKGPEPVEDETTQLPNATDGSRTADVDFTVPPGASLQEIRIVVHDKTGEHEVYRRNHQPGETVHVTVHGQGPDAVVETYDSGLLYDRQHF